MDAAKTNAPRTNPIKGPTIETMSAIVESFSDLVFAIIARTSATGPKMIGNRSSETPPKIIARIDNAFPLLLGTGFVDIQCLLLVVDL
jgi:hypothetical protein